MADTEKWTKWYRTGTVNVTKDSPYIVGSGTYWLSASLHAGDTFTLDGAQDYEVLEVVDDTHLTLATPYLGTTSTTQTYAINRSFSATQSAEVAAETASLVQKIARYIDTDMKTVQGLSAYEVAVAGGYAGTESQWLASLVGKSAYEVAKSGGYTGTQAEWLESLKAAGEWSKLDTRTKFIDEALNRNVNYTNYGAGIDKDRLSQGGTHSGIIRGKYLGEAITDEQWAEIAIGRYNDLYVGDYWDIPTTFEFFPYAISTKNSWVSNEDIVAGEWVNTEIKIRWTIAALDYMRRPAYDELYPGRTDLNPYTYDQGYPVLLVGTIWGNYYTQKFGTNKDSWYGGFMYNAPDHEPDPVDISGGFAGTDCYTRVLPSMQAYYTELWGANHLVKFTFDTISSDLNGGTVKNQLAITVPPVRLFYPEASESDYPAGGFNWGMLDLATRLHLLRWTGDFISSRNLSADKTGFACKRGHEGQGTEYDTIKPTGPWSGVSKLVMLIR